jgi:hypothetical protein
MTSGSDVLVNMAKYTEDGHLIGRDGWLMPKDALEFYDRYKEKVDMFSKSFRRNNDWKETAQATWAHLFSRPSDKSHHPEATDYIHYLTLKFAEHPQEDIHISAMLAYVKCMVHTKGLLDSKESDALCSYLHQGSTLSITYQDAWTNQLLDYEEWIEESRLKSADPMRNDPDRVLYLQEFLTFVEKRDPDLVPFILKLDNHPLRRTKSTPAVERKKVLALADEFRGLPVSGREEWHPTPNSEGWSNKPRVVRSKKGVNSTTELLRLIAESPNGMTVKEAARVLGVAQNLISGKATNLRTAGCVVKTGERRENAAVLRATGVPIAPPGRKYKNLHLIAGLEVGEKRFIGFEHPDQTIHTLQAKLTATGLYHGRKSGQRFKVNKSSGGVIVTRVN